MPSDAKRVVAALIRASRLGVVLPLELTVRLYGGTDKGIQGYLPYYQRHLRHLRYRQNRILEIGVGGWSSADRYASPQVGGSLRVWRDYFPRSRIVGFDVEHKVVDLGDRVVLVQGDQASPVDLARVVPALGGPPNIVIDDGSHLVEHARASFNHLFPLMPAGSVYVVEDICTSYWESFGGGPVAPGATAIGLAKDLVDAVQAQDATAGRLGESKAPFVIADVAEVHTYPGLFLVVKLG